MLQWIRRPWLQQVQRGGPHDKRGSARLQQLAVPTAGSRRRADIGFVQKNIQLSSLSCAPPWLLSSPSVDFSLTALSKSDTSPEIFQSKFLEVCEGLKDHYHVYSDGSRMNSLVGAAAVGRMSLRYYGLHTKPAFSQQNSLP